MEKHIFENTIDAFKNIGYKNSLIRKDYKYADLFSVDVPTE